VVAYATRERQYLWAIELPLAGTIADAIEAARRVANLPEAPWETAPVGIFGELRDRSDQPADGDRVELYRPLHRDPRDQRRDRVRQARKGTGR
jgi:putative ubiquitin-RnfH superfamily antitoxin RatB of RatAB toxin-antitoxin module